MKIRSTTPAKSCDKSCKVGYAHQCQKYSKRWWAKPTLPSIDVVDFLDWSGSRVLAFGISMVVLLGCGAKVHDKPAESIGSQSPGYSVDVPDFDRLESHATAPGSEKNCKLEARRQAMSDLSQQLSVRVRSTSWYKLSIKNDRVNNDHFAQDIQIISDMPVQGHRIVEWTKNGFCHCRIVLDKIKARPQYEKYAEELALETDQYMNEAIQAKDRRTRLDMLQRTKSARMNYRQYSLAAKLLGSDFVAKPKTSLYEISKALNSAKSTPASDIYGLADMLIDKLDKNEIRSSVFIYPLRFNGADAYTPFSAKIQGALNTACTNRGIEVRNDETGAFFVSGSYYPDRKKQLLDVHLTVTDSHGKIIVSAYDSMRVDDIDTFIPSNVKGNGIDNDLNIDGRLTVQARINGRSKHLLFKEGDDLDIQIKVSHAAYVYIVMNFRSKTGTAFQAMLPVSHDKGNKKYQLYIPEQKAGFWVSLSRSAEGDYEVSEPFGRENIQIFAADQEMLHRLPRLASLPIDGDTIDGVVVDEHLSILDPSIATRQFRIMKRKDETALVLSEALLTYTTIPISTSPSSESQTRMY